MVLESWLTSNKIGRSRGEDTVSSLVTNLRFLWNEPAHLPMTPGHGGIPIVYSIGLIGIDGSRARARIRETAHNPKQVLCTLFPGGGTASNRKMAGACGLFEVSTVEH
jgi:hypothetical protein